MVIIYCEIIVESVAFSFNVGFHAETLMTILKVKTSREKNLLLVQSQYSKNEIFQKLEPKKAIHNEDLIFRLIRRFCSFCVENWLVSLYQKIQPGLSGLLYLHQKRICLRSLPYVYAFILIEQ